MRIGLLHMGDNHEYIWGSAITTFYIGEEFRRMGHDVWRASVELDDVDWNSITAHRTNIVIAEGVVAHKVPDVVWQTTDYVVQWWLTTLFYDAEHIARSPFHAIATNSPEMTNSIRKAGKPAATILLAAPEEFKAAVPHKAYESFATYLGTYPHKSEEQMALMFKPAVEYGLTLWGYGWDESPYQNWYKGVLPLTDIGSLYKSASVSFALTEMKQKKMNMINNRVFEVLSCETALVSEPYSGLQTHELGQFIHFVDDQKMLEDVLLMIKTEPKIKRNAREAAAFIFEKHTYKQRAEAFLEFYQQDLYKK